MQISSNCSFKNVFMSKRNVQKSCANILVCNIAHAINVIKDTNTVKSVTQDSPKDVWLDIQTPWSEGKLNQQWWWSCYFLNKRPCREKKKARRRHLILWIILITESCLTEVKKKCEGCLDLLFFANPTIPLISPVASYIIHLLLD